MLLTSDRNCIITLETFYSHITRDVASVLDNRIDIMTSSSYNSILLHFHKDLTLYYVFPSYPTLAYRIRS